MMGTVAQWHSGTANCCAQVLKRARRRYLTMLLRTNQYGVAHIYTKGTIDMGCLSPPTH
jgi:hypothetical protein